MIEQLPRQIIIKGKNIRLRSIDVSDVEIMRSWRNSEDIRNCHIYRGVVSVEEQYQWFERIQKSDTDLFFVIEKGCRKYGIAKVQDVDWYKEEGHTGIFIADPADRSSSVSVEAALLAADYFFNKMGLKKLTAMALASNTDSTSFIEKMGFTMWQCDEKLIGGCIEQVNHYWATAEEYFRCTSRIRRRFVRN